MNSFIEVNLADGCKALLPIENILYVAELSQYESIKATIYVKFDRAFDVRESIAEIAAKIAQANATTKP